MSQLCAMGSCLNTSKVSNSNKNIEVIECTKKREMPMANMSETADIKNGDQIRHIPNALRHASKVSTLNEVIECTKKQEMPVASTSEIEDMKNGDQIRLIPNAFRHTSKVSTLHEDKLSECTKSQEMPAAATTSIESFRDIETANQTCSNLNSLKRAHDDFNIATLNFFTKNELEKYMDEAFILARESLEAQEVPIGSVFVYRNEILARGHNTVNRTKNATRHAEFNCIDFVLEHCRKNNLCYKSVFKEIDVVVTIEPCIMCADALLGLGVRSVIYGARNDRFGGETVFNIVDFYKKYKTSPSTVLIGGFRATDAIDLLKEFYKGENPNAPEYKRKKKE